MRNTGFSGLLCAGCVVQAALNPSGFPLRASLGSLRTKRHVAVSRHPPWGSSGAAGSSPWGTAGLQEASWLCSAGWMSQLPASGSAAVGDSEGCETLQRVLAGKGRAQLPAPVSAQQHIKTPGESNPALSCPLTRGDMSLIGTIGSNSSPGKFGRATS